MPVSEIKNDVPVGFDGPTALPLDDQQAQRWQQANREWWESHPMRYDFSENVEIEEFSPAFFDEVDRRFFADAATYLPSNKLAFDALIDFSSLKNKDVLEIGVGMGSHAELLASHARSFTGIDLTEYAVDATRRRMKLRGLDREGTTLRQMDAEALEFTDSSFDLIWSWGVIHHSSNTQRILREMQRVLRPGGTTTIMVYHRSFWNYYIYAGLFGGLVKGKLFRTGSLHKVRQSEIDGAIARFYTEREWRELVGDLFTVDEVQILGSKTELVPLPAGRLKTAALHAIPDAIGRLFTNNFRFGTFLVSTLRKS